ncbi:MAG TPA: hypothetical protein VEJ23_06130, partial [Solirubrobacteraceae bacterium]|nr:hypothetical protein [Solirubrobacteraceae bacterium]
MTDTAARTAPPAPGADARPTLLVLDGDGRAASSWAGIAGRLGDDLRLVVSAAPNAGPAHVLAAGPVGAALELARTHPERVRSLVLIAPSGALEAAALARLAVP